MISASRSPLWRRSVHLFSSKWSSVVTTMASPSKRLKESKRSIEDIEADIDVDRSNASVSLNEKRCRLLHGDPDGLLSERSSVVYWMSRDQRCHDNWALIKAQKLALEKQSELHVVFCLVPKFLDATIRHYDFLLRGLEETQMALRALDIPMHVLEGEASHVLMPFLKKIGANTLVTDFSPLRKPLKWVQDVKREIEKLEDSNMLFYQVDTHNIVPCWVASDKQEYAARTIRPKITQKLKEFLTEFVPLVKHVHNEAYIKKNKEVNIDFNDLRKRLEVNTTVEPVQWIQPGTKAALLNLENFCETRLRDYNTRRNDPTEEGLSNLSPWFHFGQLSAQRAILYVKKKAGKSKKEGLETFIEEAVVRRELSDNYCFYQPNYDNLQGAHEWARKTLDEHRKDKREHVYTKAQLEKAETHDDLWNAAQMQMVTKAKMHGFLRMYWAKKILEWTKSPEDALSISMYLNDKYNLDGRDPSGYVGCMWSIAGVHDRGWPERKIFGKIRFMNYDGCKRKFDVAKFVRKYSKGKDHPFRKGTSKKT